MSNGDAPMRDLLTRYDHFLVDLWGVVWDGQDLFPEAVEFCRRLMEREDKDLLFLSNTSEHVAEEVVGLLREAGLEKTDLRHIATSGQALQAWFAAHGLAGKPVYVVGCESVVENVRRAGGLPLEMPRDGLELKTRARSDTLVIGGLTNPDWERLEEIATGVAAAGLRLVLPNPDRVVIRQSGRVRLPPGMVAHVIETALPGVRVDYVGKPYAFIYDYAFERLGERACRGRALMIGDSLDTDVRGANAAGVASLLLGQGVHRGQSLESIRKQAVQGKNFPDLFAARLAVEETVLSLNWKKDKS